MAQLKLAEGPAAGTPAPGQVTLYAKTNGLLYSKDDTGAETQLGGGGGGGQLGTKFHLRAGDVFVVQADYQYLIKGAAMIVDPGASFTTLPGSQLVLIP